MFVGTKSDPARPLTIAGGRYIDRPQRRDGRWAIAARVCLIEWQTESISLLTPEAVEFLAPIQTVARDRTDTSYERPLVINRAASSTGRPPTRFERLRGSFNGGFAG
ncbi:hypothetical protein [Mycobacterium sp.]|uniref:hypothetical protein n=1 Tax=Mycobacterium sp. TaxID=1785 RepID=UPI002C9EA31C|nr:hypothetical protein [Mycobacterium sp.]HME47025.1 hypothetical protein [Mycobacterium sp.]